MSSYPLQHMVTRRTMCRMATTYTMPRPAATLGGRIAQARRFADIDQAILAHLIDVDRKTLSSWENDHTAPTVPQFLRLAAATGFPAGWFIEGLDAEEPGPRRPGLLVKYAPRDSNPEPADYARDDDCVQLDLLAPTPEPLHLWN